MEQEPQNDERVTAEGAAEPDTDDKADITPVELFDPEEFGYRRIARPDNQERWP
jgi:hypothetical protein